MNSQSHTIDCDAFSSFPVFHRTLFLVKSKGCVTYDISSSSFLFSFLFFKLLRISYCNAMKLPCIDLHETFHGLKVEKTKVLSKLI